MLGKEDGPFAAAGRTKVEALAGKRPEVVVSTFRVGTTDTRDALKVVATGAKPPAELLDTLKAVPAVGGGVLLIVLPAEIIEVLIEDGMQVVPTARHVPFGRDRLRESCCPHIYLYGRNGLPASRNR